MLFEIGIIGASGQDGYFMTRYLLKKGLSVLAIVRSKKKNILELKSKYKKRIKIVEIKKMDKKNYLKLLNNFRIKKIFFFAGFSKIPNNSLQKKKCISGNFEIFREFLEACLMLKFVPKILYLSSGEIFGTNQKHRKNENSKILAENCYSECKIKSVKLISYYRKKYNFFISNAICYNHESIFTPKNHIIRKIINLLKKKDNKIVKFYNPDEMRNISHIYDFLPYFDKILNLKKNADYIFANNENYSIKMIVEYLNKFYNKKISYVKNDAYKMSRNGNNAKIRNFLAYCPKFNTKKILTRMISYEKKNVYLK